MERLIRHLQLINLKTYNSIFKYCEIVAYTMKGLHWWVLSKDVWMNNSIRHLFASLMLFMFLFFNLDSGCLVQEFTDIEAYGDMPMNMSSLRLFNKANIFFQSHIRFDLEKYICQAKHVYLTMTH